MLAALLLNLDDYYPKPAQEVAGLGQSSGSWGGKVRRVSLADGATREQAIQEAKEHIAQLERMQREKIAIQARSKLRVIKGGRDARGFDVVALGLASAIAPELEGEAALQAAMALEDDEAMAVFMIMALID